MAKDHRIFRRAPISLKIRMSESGDDISIKFDTANLSEGGIFVKSSLLWEPTQEFDLSFLLPDNDKEICVRGVVVRNEDKYSLIIDADEEESIPGMGIKFIDLSEEDRMAIREYIDSLTKA